MPCLLKVSKSARPSSQSEVSVGKPKDPAATRRRMRAAMKASWKRRRAALENGITPHRLPLNTELDAYNEIRAVLKRLPTESQVVVAALVKHNFSPIRDA